MSTPRHVHFQDDAQSPVCTWAGHETRRHNCLRHYVHVKAQKTTQCGEVGAALHSATRMLTGRSATSLAYKLVGTCRVPPGAHCAVPGSPRLLLRCDHRHVSHANCAELLFKLLDSLLSSFRSCNVCFVAKFVAKFHQGLIDQRTETLGCSLRSQGAGSAANPAKDQGAVLLQPASTALQLFSTRGAVFAAVGMQSHMSFPSSHNEALVDSLVASTIISSSSRVEAALRATDRAYFSPMLPYVDAAQPLPFANASITAPHMAARVLSLLTHTLRPGSAVLDVGAGSGYLTAAFAAMVVSDPAPGTPAGCVVGVEHSSELAAAARTAVAAATPPETAAVVRILEGDGRLGAPAFAPFDAIYVSAAAESVPQPLIDQLAPGGRMLCPVGPAGGTQMLVSIDRTVEGTVQETKVMPVRTVPLCDIETQLRGDFSVL